MAARKITYVKLLEKMKLNDGTLLEKGTSVRLNYREGPFFNVELYDSHNVKRIFWISEDKAKVSVTRTEKWTPKMAREYQMDLAETWFDTNSEVEKIQVKEKKTTIDKKEKTKTKKSDVKKTSHMRKSR